MVVSQDVICRDILRERDHLDKKSAIELIDLAVDFEISQESIIILEGIFISSNVYEANQ